MSGELTGCASGFKTEEDALRVGWPTLLAGALLYRTAKEPYDGPQACAASEDAPARDNGAWRRRDHGEGWEGGAIERRALNDAVGTAQMPSRQEGAGAG